MRSLTGWIRALRARRARWNSHTDREFHDALFASHDHEAFSPAYTGNITIRRFADLAAPAVERSDGVLDVGCGLGEITCELARRYPGVRFTGIDHSRAGIEGARRNAERLGLTNLTFEVQDMERYVPVAPVGLVTMFDSFHHLVDPHAFVRRMATRTNRFLLIEPQGDWKGSWARGLDFDWLAQDLETIRLRLAHAVGEARPPAASSGTMDAGHEPHEQGEPVENRYGVDALAAMFPGFGLRVRGTVSGIDVYPPDPTLDTATRREFGELGYALYRSVDDRLYEAGLDLHAKHLVVYAEAGMPTERRERRPLPEALVPAKLRGAYDVEYLAYDGPTEVAAAASWHATVTLRNRSFRALRSDAGDAPVLLSYHWLDDHGRVIVADGRRSPLPRPLAPDEEARAALGVLAPGEPGRYVLAIELVEEGRTWFQDAGAPPLEVRVRVVG